MKSYHIVARNLNGIFVTTLKAANKDIAIETFMNKYGSSAYLIEVYEFNTFEPLDELAQRTSHFPQKIKNIIPHF